MGEVYFLSQVRNGERWVFVFDRSSSAELLHTLGCYAADPELNFTWYDAAVLSQRARWLLRDVDDLEDAA